MTEHLEILNILEQSRFPVVDFKLQNRGTAKSLLRRFSILVDHIEVDPKPVLVSESSIHSPLEDSRLSRHSSSLIFGGGDQKGDLGVNLLNRGWGPAIELELAISPPLREIFPEHSSHRTANLDDGEKLRPAFSLPASAIDHSMLKTIRVAADPIKESPFEPPLNRNIPADCIAINRLGADVSFKDACGVRYQEELHIGLPGDHGSLFLGANGFNWISREYHPPSACMSMPEAIYYVCLHPENGETRKSYKMSHVISSGDIEHLNIMVGAEKSCKASLRFEFDVDGEHTVTSEPFKIHIWNPRDSGYHYGLTNGDELISRMRKEYLARLEQEGRDDRQSFREYSPSQDDIGSSGFPFLRPSPRGVW